MNSKLLRCLLLCLLSYFTYTVASSEKEDSSTTSTPNFMESDEELTANENALLPDENDNEGSNEISQENQTETPETTHTAIDENSTTTGANREPLDDRRYPTPTKEPGFDFDDAEISKHSLWPGGTIHYYIDKESYDKDLRDEIRMKLDEARDLTGLNFIEIQDITADWAEKRYVFFINRAGLHKSIDQVKLTMKGPQKITLGYDCLAKGCAVPRAVLFLAGVPPQHNSPDRDLYIKIKDNNIRDDKKQMFKKLNNNEWLFHDVPYDFKSISHYTYFTHSKDGAPTILPVNSNNFNVGEYTTYSDSDILKIQMLYNYISFKAKKSITAKQTCNKLFKPGPNFNINPPKIEVKPRSFPFKYKNDGGVYDKSTAKPTEADHDKSEDAPFSDNDKSEDAPFSDNDKSEDAPISDNDKSEDPPISDNDSGKDEPNYPDKDSTTSPGNTTHAYHKDEYTKAARKRKFKNGKKVQSNIVGDRKEINNKTKQKLGTYDDYQYF